MVDDVCESLDQNSFKSIECYHQSVCASLDRPFNYWPISSLHCTKRQIKRSKSCKTMRKKTKSKSKGREGKGKAIPIAIAIRIPDRGKDNGNNWPQLETSIEESLALVRPAIKTSL